MYFVKEGYHILQYRVPYIADTSPAILHSRKLTHAMPAKPVQFHQKREDVK
jgi:hypothetical protein